MRYRACTVHFLPRADLCAVRAVTGAVHAAPGAFEWSPRKCSGCAALRPQPTRLHRSWRFPIAAAQPLGLCCRLCRCAQPCPCPQDSGMDCNRGCNGLLV